MNSQSISQKKNIASLISNIKKSLYYDEKDISRHFKNLKIDTKEINRFVFFNKDFYTRNLIFKDSQIELMLICWEVGHKTPIHDHNQSNGIMLTLKGSLKESIYTFSKTKKEISESSIRLVQENNFSCISDDVGYHSIENNAQGRSISLHLYYKPIDFCYAYTLNSPKKTKRYLSFYSLNGQLKNDIERLQGKHL